MVLSYYSNYNFISLLRYLWQIKEVGLYTARSMLIKTLNQISKSSKSMRLFNITLTFQV